MCVRVYVCVCVWGGGVNRKLFCFKINRESCLGRDHQDISFVDAVQYEELFAMKISRKSCWGWRSIATVI